MNETAWIELRTELEIRLQASDERETDLLEQLDELWLEHLRVKRELAELRASTARKRTEGAMSTRLRDALRE